MLGFPYDRAGSGYREQKLHTWFVCYGLKLELVMLKVIGMYMFMNKISKSQTCLYNF